MVLDELLGSLADVLLLFPASVRFPSAEADRHGRNSFADRADAARLLRDLSRLRPEPTRRLLPDPGRDCEACPLDVHVVLLALCALLRQLVHVGRLKEQACRQD